MAQRDGRCRPPRPSNLILFETRNGLGLPRCGRGVTVLISTKAEAEHRVGNAHLDRDRGSTRSGEASLLGRRGAIPCGGLDPVEALRHE